MTSASGYYYYIEARIRDLVLPLLPPSRNTLRSLYSVPMPDCLSGSGLQALSLHTILVECEILKLPLDMERSQ